MKTNIRVLRSARYPTVREFANKVGIPETQLCRIERGRSWIPPKWRELLAKALGVETEAFCDPVTGMPTWHRPEKRGETGGVHKSTSVGRTPPVANSR